jgi:hypothetical protein
LAAVIAEYVASFILVFVRIMIPPVRVFPNACCINNNQLRSNRFNKE